ncbi:hypothetical protein C2G38_2056895 [Gigaspora rosea]|uniref:Uncharacterized protein n=1 Tax=Gigaspora rosea TaxID=44941 RepID=A0A397W3K8_9GLOM|nr:hypothetical protein C2G38_2056895 [Gigaspora rosea]
MFLIYTCATRHFLFVAALLIHLCHVLMLVGIFLCQRVVFSDFCRHFLTCIFYNHHEFISRFCVLYIGSLYAFCSI